MPNENEFTRRNRKWLDQGGLSTRPWLILASAPNPTIPKDLPKNTAYVYVKWAGKTGKELGLPAPDLIMVNENLWSGQTKGLTCGRTLVLTSRRRRIFVEKVRAFLPLKTRSYMHISNVEKWRMLDELLGDAFRGVGTMEHPSNGIALIAYGIRMGVPRIIISGMSLTDDGHTNPGRKKHQRLHKEEDEASFRYFAKHHPNVMTSEPELSALTGLPLYTK